MAWDQGLYAQNITKLKHQNASRLRITTLQTTSPARSAFRNERKLAHGVSTARLICDIVEVQCLPIQPFDWPTLLCLSSLPYVCSNQTEYILTTDTSVMLYSWQNTHNKATNKNWVVRQGVGPDSYLAGGKKSDHSGCQPQQGYRSKLTS